MSERHYFQAEPTDTSSSVCEAAVGPMADLSSPVVHERYSETQSQTKGNRKHRSRRKKEKSSKVGDRLPSLAGASPSRRCEAETFGPPSVVHFPQRTRRRVKLTRGQAPMSSTAMRAYETRARKFMVQNQQRSRAIKLRVVEHEQSALRSNAVLPPILGGSSPLTRNRDPMAARTLRTIQRRVLQNEY